MASHSLEYAAYRAQPLNADERRNDARTALCESLTRALATRVWVHSGQTARTLPAAISARAASTRAATKHLAVRRRLASSRHKRNAFVAVRPKRTCAIESARCDDTRAAVNPDERGEIFFVATGLPDGSHEFSRTLAEHEAAVRRYLVRYRKRQTER